MVFQGGVAVAYWVDYGMSYVDNGAQWRFPIALQIFFAVSTIMILLPLPETPRWLVKQDKRDEALEILTRLHANDGVAHAQRDLLEIQAALHEERVAQAMLNAQGLVISFPCLSRALYLHASDQFALSSPMANNASSIGLC